MPNSRGGGCVRVNVEGGRRRRWRRRAASTAFCGIARRARAARKGRQKSSGRYVGHIHVGWWRRRRWWAPYFNTGVVVVATAAAWTSVDRRRRPPPTPPQPRRVQHAHAHSQARDVYTNTKSTHTHGAPAQYVDASSVGVCMCVCVCWRRCVKPSTLADWPGRSRPIRTRLSLTLGPGRRCCHIAAAATQSVGTERANRCRRRRHRCRCCGRSSSVASRLYTAPPCLHIIARTHHRHSYLR